MIEIVRKVNRGKVILKVTISNIIIVQVGCKESQKEEF